ncbi:hypothetical protein ACRAWG_06385 [Methylobacterium sp. P31]
MGAVISFFRPASTSLGGWSQQELAEFYRVEAALIRAGLQIGSEQGLSDEAEPWFVFCRPDGDAIMHFARIDGSYVIASEVLDSPMRGSDFRALINQVAQRYPRLLPIPQGADGAKLSVHPAALLAALVAAAALSLSPDDAHADDREHPGHSPVPASQAGQTLQHEPASAGDSGDADDRDSHRKQVGIIVFSAMVFAADAFAADLVAPGTESGLFFGSQGSNGAASWDPGSVPVSTGEAAGAANPNVPLTSGSLGHTASGASGFITAEPTSAMPSQSGNADFGGTGLGNPTLLHSPALTNLEPAYQTSARPAQTSTAGDGGSSSSPEAGSDAGASGSGTAEASGQAGTSIGTTGETASQTQSASQVTGHSAPEAPSAQIDGITATAQSDRSHLSPAHGEDGSGRQNHAARTVADAGHSGTSEGGSDQSPHGVEGHGAATGTSASHQSGTPQAEASGADPGHAQAGESAGKSAEAPSQLNGTGSDPHGADGHGAATGTSTSHQSGTPQAEASGADPGHAQAGESAGKSAEAPSQLNGTGSDPHGADGHGAATGTSTSHQSGTPQAEASGADPGHAQAGESAGKSAEAPSQLNGTGSDPHGADGHGAATGTSTSHQSGTPQAEASGADPGHAQPNSGEGATHNNAVAAANPASRAGSDQPTDPPGSGAAAPVSGDQPAVPVSGDQPASTSQTSHASAQSQATSPAARVDPAGNIVFSSDGPHGQAAAPSHASADGGTHGEVGLIGVSDHGAHVHHFDLHS